MSAIRVPSDAFRLFAHQQEALAAFQAGATRMIWKWHRAAGKGVASVALMALAAFERPATYCHVSPTFRKAREDQWDALDPNTGRPYLDMIPRELVLDRNENEMTVTMRAREPGKVSRLIWLSADDPDRLRGLHPAGCVLDEFAVMDGPEALHVVRPALAASEGWLLITSTPRGLNHFHQTWRNAEAAGNWYLSTKTIEDTRRHDGTAIIPMAHIEQERREGQNETWLRQEFWCEFSAALATAYFADLLTTAEREGRIGDVPHRPGVPVSTAWDLGIRDASAVLHIQAIGDMLHVIRAEEFEGLALPEIISRVQRHGYVFKRHYAPHDIEVRDFTAGVTRKEVAARLGFRFQTVPRLSVAEGIDAVRRLFGRLRFDRRHAERLVQALGAYEKVWDPRAKAFRDAPLHNWASHPSDALRCFAVGYRDAGDRGSTAQRPAVITRFDPINHNRASGAPRVVSRWTP